LVHAAPRAFYEVGLVVTVGVAFVPSIIGTVGRVRDADRARCGGVPPRRGRLLRYAIPVLENGMEQAVALAESMDARGFAGAGGTAVDHAAGWLLVGALTSFVGAFVALVSRNTKVALVLAVAGVVALAWAVAVSSRRAARPRYRPRRMGWADGALIAAAVAAPVLIGLIAVFGTGSLTWRTGQPFHAPPFDVIVAGAILLLAAPAVWLAPKSAEVAA
jgi:energy-coupling factor transport system permease protein